MIQAEWYFVVVVVVFFEGEEFIGKGDDTFDLKVPRLGDRTASGGSSFQSLTVQGKKVLLL